MSGAPSRRPVSKTKAQANSPTGNVTSTGWIGWPEIRRRVSTRHARFTRWRTIGNTGPMRKLIYYVGMSIDGRIAGPDGSIEFFPLAEVMGWIAEEYPETLPAHVR